MLHLDIAPNHLKQLIRQLLTACLEEFALASGEAPERDADGQPSYHYFDLYWQEAEVARVAFAIWLEDTLVGFCFLRDTERAWQVAEFYIAPSYRRRGMGAAAVLAIKTYCQAQGRHQLLEARTLLWNAAARDFWRAQGFRTVAAAEESLQNVLTWVLY